jgi:hypothetical protein
MNRNRSPKMAEQIGKVYWTHVEQYDDGTLRSATTVFLSEIAHFQYEYVRKIRETGQDSRYVNAVLKSGAKVNIHGPQAELFMAAMGQYLVSVAPTPLDQHGRKVPVEIPQ